MENYQVSARKYRPDSFDMVVGQAALTTTLKNAIKQRQLAHAYLFCGPRGVGKTTCARIFAKTINCMNLKADGEACNQCESCNSFNQQRSLNIFELDAASNNSVDGIRQLTEQVRIPPQLGTYKVYIIDEVHMLSTQAFNAFLKTLEEPPHHAIFILATTEKHKILPTILSRCQIFDFNRIGIEDIVEQLRFVAKSEQIEVEEEALHIIAVKSDGGMRDALSIFDQVASYGGGRVHYQAAIDNLNVLDYDYFFKVMDALTDGDYAQALLIFDDVLNHGFDGQHFINGLASHLRDLLMSRDRATLSLLEVGPAIRNKYGEQAQSCSQGFLITGLRLCNECDLAYRDSKNKRLLVELTLIRLAQLSDSKKKIIEVLEEAPLPPLADLQATTTTVEPTAAIKEPVKPVAAVTTPTPPTPRPAKTHIPNTGMRSIRIKRSAYTPEEAEAATRSEQQKNSVLENKTFDEDTLKRAWMDFADTIEEDIHLSNALKMLQPMVRPEHRVEVLVSNQVVQRKLEQLQMELLNHLRGKLRNSLIQLDILLDEREETFKPFTAREKFDVMAKKNPNLLLLYKTFGLDIH